MEQRAAFKHLEKKGKSAIGHLTAPLRILIPMAVAFIITGSFSACKKNEVKKPVCRIISTALPSSGTIYHLSYNGNGRISRVTAGPLDIIYDYTGNTTIVTTLDTGKFRTKSIITTNAVGMATNVRTESNLTGTEWTNTIYEYNGEELSRSIFTSSAGGNPSTSTYTWSDHNLTSIISGAGITVLDYYTDKPKQSGDYFSFVQLVQGYEVYRNKNLLKTVSNITLVYAFDPDGNISSIVAGANGTPLLEYGYECN